MDNRIIKRILMKHFGIESSKELRNFEVIYISHGQSEFIYDTGKYLLCTPIAYKSIAAKINSYTDKVFDPEYIFSFVPNGHLFSKYDKDCVLYIVDRILEMEDTIDNRALKLLLGKKYMNFIADSIDVDNEDLKGYGERSTINYNNQTYYLYEYLGNEDLNNE